MKKFAALILAIVLMAAFSVPAFAATTNVFPIDTKARVDCKVYSSTSTTSTVKKSLSKGDKVTVTMNADSFSWAKVSTGGYIQFKNTTMNKDDYTAGLFGAGMWNLKEKDQGTCVKNLQAALNKTLGLSLTKDGIFGAATTKAVKQFQGKYAGSDGKPLTQDGIVGYETRWSLVTKLGLPPAIN